MLFAFRELLNQRKDGSSFWNEVYLSPVFDDSGELVQYIGIQHDVTERIEAGELAGAAALIWRNGSVLRVVTEGRHDDLLAGDPAYRAVVARAMDEEVRA